MYFITNTIEIEMASMVGSDKFFTMLNFVQVQNNKKKILLPWTWIVFSIKKNAWLHCTPC